MALLYNSFFLCSWNRNRESDIYWLVKVEFFFMALNIIFHDGVLLYKRQIEHDGTCREMFTKEFWEFWKILLSV